MAYHVSQDATASTYMPDFGDNQGMRAPRQRPDFFRCWPARSPGIVVVGSAGHGRTGPLLVSHPGRYSAGGGYGISCLPGRHREHV